MTILESVRQREEELRAEAEVAIKPLLEEIVDYLKESSSVYICEVTLHTFERFKCYHNIFPPFFIIYIRFLHLTARIFLSLHDL